VVLGSGEGSDYRAERKVLSLTIIWEGDFHDILGRLPASVGEIMYAFNTLSIVLES